MATSGSESSGWIGVDLDGTLAEYNGWQGPELIGPPIPLMVNRVKAWLAAGKEVRIFTARVSGNVFTAERFTAMLAIERWCEEHLGQKLAVTCTKDFKMVELWDDRAVAVVHNTGIIIGDRER